MPGPGILFILSICLSLSVFACRMLRCLFFFLALKLSILPILSCCLDVLGGYLMPLYTHHLDDSLTSMWDFIIRRNQIKISISRASVNSKQVRRDNGVL
jgi:hypothetical protein